MNETQPKLQNKPRKKTSRRRPVARPLEMPQPALSFVPRAVAPNAGGILSSILGWLRARRAQSLQTSKLRVSETIQLGDKRFVSVVHVDGRRFLIGGSSTSVALLTQLDSAEAPFGEALRKAAAPRKRSTSTRTRKAA
ncbi:Flagellar biosynthesis protein, FliO [Bryocella elongata]|uniref:Flagellar biosynthesis protein, FliO n=1 Tax=Bryocella elongata TaxID=863522 RepID=A0A1H5TJ42_9BACT|nr:flagellar biosynthetic protein FliO [Bryocella elongata]SEF62784.1 Flagellar biosynthesis protein, FliO [Bryocella elongata]